MYIVLDGDPGAPKERGTVRLCGFRHIATSGLSVWAIHASFIAVFAIYCPHISHLSTITDAVDAKRHSLTLFPVLLKREVVFNGHMVEDRYIYCIKVK